MGTVCHSETSKEGNIALHAPLRDLMWCQRMFTIVNSECIALADMRRSSVCR